MSNKTYKCIQANRTFVANNRMIGCRCHHRRNRTATIHWIIIFQITQIFHIPCGHLCYCSGSRSHFRFSINGSTRLYFQVHRRMNAMLHGLWVSDRGIYCLAKVTQKFDFMQPLSRFCSSVYACRCPFLVSLHPLLLRRSFPRHSLNFLPSSLYSSKNIWRVWSVAK